MKKTIKGGIETGNKDGIGEGFKNKNKIQAWAFGSTSTHTYLPSELGPPYNVGAIFLLI